MWFWKSRERFSLDELKYLSEQLQRVTVVNESNKDFVIETLRSIAEHMIWGDQHDPSFFDYFMEKQVMAHFLRILKDSNKNSGVAVQLLQTLSIIIGNIRSEHAIYYLFSNEYINNFITYPFDFRHEETLAYYISFLRTISTKLDQNTVSFFIKTKNDEVVSFPLYSEAIKLFHHEESMVRIAVRTLTLNVYNVDDECIQNFVMSPPVVGYFSDLVTFLRQQSINLDSLVAEAARTPQSAVTVGRLEGAIAEIGDLLFYCNDIMCSGIPRLNELMSKHIANILVLPVLIPSLCPAVDSATSTGGLQVSPLCSMYLLSRLTHVVKRKPLVNYVSAGLLQNTQPASSAVKENGFVATSFSTLSLNDDDSSQNSSPLKEEGSGRSEGDVYRGNEGAHHTASCQSRSMSPSGSNVSASGNNGPALIEEDYAFPLERKESLLAHLLHDDEKLVLAALCVLVSLLQNEALDDMLLDALGILPRRKRHKQMLLQALMGSQSEEEPELFSDPPERFEDDVPLGIPNFQIGDYVDFVNVQKKPSPDYAGDRDVWGLKTKHRSEVLDALMQLLCRRPPPCAEALWHAGWLLRQLLPSHEHRLSLHRLSLLDSAYEAAREDIIKELTDCWCDVIPSVVTDEWKVCRKALESPSLQRDSSFVLLPRTTDPRTEGDVSSSVAGERMRAAVKVFVALHQMKSFLSDGTFPEFPILAEPREEPGSFVSRLGLKLSSVRVGTEVDLIEGKAMPCRVAFERGKERSVFLLVVHKEKDASSWLILADETPSRNGRGIVRVIAPLAGSKPRVDDDHPRWLHLRIRSPHWPSADAGKLGTGGSRVKRLVDGRWTLAFLDEESCKHAQALVAEMIEIQSKLVKQVLAPLLDPSPPHRSLEKLVSENDVSNS